MDKTPEVIPVSDTVIQAQVHALATLIQETEAYQAFIQAYQAAVSDASVQRLAAQIREHNRALQWAEGDFLAHQQALETLQAEMNALPLMQTYRQAEADLVRLFTAVDQEISTALGLPFARNARRSGCACGR